MRLKQIRIAANMKNTDLASSVGIDAPALSKLETGKFLPTPKTLRAICNLLSVKPLDVYDMHEIDLAGCMSVRKHRTARNDTKRKFVPKVQFRRSEMACKLLQRDILRKHGYNSAQEWFDECIEELNRRINNEQATR